MSNAGTPRSAAASPSQAGPIDWLRLHAQLEAHISSLSDPRRLARARFQCGRLLELAGGHDAKARQAYEAALEICPAFLPAYLALRDVAVERDDLDLARRLFQRVLDMHEAGARGEGDAPEDAVPALFEPCDLKEIFENFTLTWLFRWPDHVRAGQALRAIESDGASGLAGRVEHLVDDSEQRRAHLSTQLAVASGDARVGVATALGCALLDAGIGVEGARALLGEAATNDLYARWRLIEDAARHERADRLADQLEAAARQTPPALGAALRFIAGEQAELSLGDRERARDLYESARRGRMQVVVALKQVLVSAWGAGDEPTVELGRAMTDESMEVGLLKVPLAVRTAELALARGDEEGAERAAKWALAQHGETQRARTLLESLYSRRRRWRELADLALPIGRGDIRSQSGRIRNDRLFLGGVYEHGLGEPEPAARLLLAQRGRSDEAGPRLTGISRPGDSNDLTLLRTLQRLYARAAGSDISPEGDAPRPFAEIAPKDLLERRLEVYLAELDRDACGASEGDLQWAHERRIDLHLRAAVVATTLVEAADRALASLYWVLDRDPESLVALRLLEHHARAQGDGKRLADALNRQLPLLEDPADRFPLLRELARWWEGAGGNPEQALDLYAEARAIRPQDGATFEDIKRLCAALDHNDGLRELLEEQLARSSDVADQVELLIALGELHERRQGDRATAQTFYEQAIVLADAEGERSPVPAGLREQALVALTRARAPVTAATVFPVDNPWPSDAPVTAVGTAEFTLAEDRTATVTASGYTEDAGSVTLEIDMPTAAQLGVGQEGNFDTLISRLAGAEAPSVDARSDAVVGGADADGQGAPDARRPLPPLAPLGPLLGVDVTAPTMAPDAETPAYGFEVLQGASAPPPPPPPDPTAIGNQTQSPPSMGVEIPKPPTSAQGHGGSVDAAAASFLGAEQAPSRRADRSRAAVRARLRRSRGGEARESWPDHGDAQLALHIGELDGAADLDGKVAAAGAMAERYESLEKLSDAIRAFQTVLGYRAGERRATDRLVDLCRKAGHWRGLADILGHEARQTGDPERKRALLLEVARLEVGPLSNPSGAITSYRGVLEINPGDPAILQELAETLRGVRRWDEYAEALKELRSVSNSPEADTSTPDAESSRAGWDLELGRVYLYRLGSAEQAAPFIERAMAVLPERVDVVADAAQVKAAMGDVDGAADLLQSAIDAASDETRGALYVRLGRVLEARDDDGSAARLSYGEALRQGVRDATLVDRLEQLAVEAGDWETLAEVLTVQLEELRAHEDEQAQKQRSEIAARLGYLCLKRLDRPRAAAAALLEAYRLTPTALELFRVIDNLLDGSPAPELRIELYETFLSRARPTLADRGAVGLRLAKAYEQSGRLDDAATALEELAALSPHDPTVLAGLERVYRHAERWSELVELYQAEADRTENPTHRLALLRRLAHALEIGVRDLAQAVTVCRRIVAHDPTDLGTIRALGRLFEALKRWDDLLELSRHELTLTQDPRQKGHICFRMGSIYETHLADLEAAAVSYESALGHDQRCVPALHSLRDLAASAQDWKQVAAYLEREVRLWDKPRERAGVLCRIAELHANQLGDTERAIDYYSQAIEAYPASVSAARALADYAFELRRFEDAAPFFRILSNQNLDKWPPASRAELFYKRGVVALELGRQREARESLEIALELNEEDLAVLEALVRAHANSHDFEAQEGELDGLRLRLDRAFERYVEADDTAKQAEVEVLRGACAEHALNLDAAEACYERAWALQPRQLDVLRALVDLHLKLRQWHPATAALRRFSDGLEAATGEDPQARASFVAALLLEGEIWCDHAVDLERAVACYKRVLKADSTHHEAHFRVAQCAYLESDFDEARRIMVALLEQCARQSVPPQIQARYTFYLGRIQQTGFQRLQLAHDHYRSALDMDPRCAPAMVGLLEVLLEQGRGDDVDRLVPQCRPLIARRGGHQGDDPATLALKTLVARLLLERDDATGAQEVLSALAERDGPGSREARFALAVVYERLDRPKAASSQIYHALDRNVCDVSGLRALAELLERHGDDDQRYRILAVLDLFRALNEGEQARLRQLEERARRALDRGSRPLSKEALEHHLVHPGWRSPLVGLVPVCEPAFAHLRSDRPRSSLSPSDLVTPRSRHPLLAELRPLVTLLGYRQFDLYIDVEQVAPLSVWAGSRPAVVVSTDLLVPPYTTADRRFLIGRALGYCRSGLARLHDLDPERTLETLAALERLFTPSDDGAGPLDAEARSDSGSDPQAELPATFVDALPRKNVDAIREIVDAGARRTLPARHTGESVLVGITRTIDRLGLLACASIRPALYGLASFDSGVRTELTPSGDLTWLIRSQPRLQDLVKFFLSESNHNLRQAAGLAI